MSAIFAPALTKYTSQLLTRISEDFKIPVDDLNAKYLTAGVPIKPKVPRKPKEPTADRPMCPFLCGNKKTPCKNRCVPNGTGCHLHDPNKVHAPKPPKETKPPKVLKGDPLFVASPVVPVPAPVRVQVQAQVEPEPEPEEPEMEMTMQERLRAMLATEDEMEEFDEDEQEFDEDEQELEY